VYSLFEPPPPIRPKASFKKKFVNLKEISRLSWSHSHNCILFFYIAWWCRYITFVFFGPVDEWNKVSESLHLFIIIQLVQTQIQNVTLFQNCFYFYFLVNSWVRSSFWKKMIFFLNFTYFLIVFIFLRKEKA
jgi:hypothetical protein